MWSLAALLPVFAVLGALLRGWPSLRAALLGLAVALNFRHREKAAGDDEHDDQEQALLGGHKDKGLIP